MVLEVELADTGLVLLESLEDLVKQSVFNSSFFAAQCLLLGYPRPQPVLKLAHAQVNNSSRATYLGTAVVTTQDDNVVLSHFDYILID